MKRQILTSKAVKEIGWNLVTLIMVMFSYGFVLNALDWALQYRWLFPFVTIPLMTILVYVGLQDLRSAEAKSYPIRKGLAIFILMIMIATAGFGALSLWLATAGWAQYDPEIPIDLFTYNYYYWWLFLDMIPVLKVTDTLGLVAPLQPVGFVAGLPVLVFRALVLFRLLKALKTWWSSRKEKNDSKIRSQSPV